MSAKATFWAWELPLESAIQKLVLLCLADCHNADTNQCNPSIAYIARKTGMDRKTVMKQIERLEAQKLVNTVKRIGAGSVYYLNIGQLQTSTKYGTSAKNGTGTNNGTQTSTKNGTRPVPNLVPEPIRNLKGNLLEKKSTRKRSLTEDLTDRSWAAT